MTIPDFQSLMAPLLKLAADGELTVPLAAQRLAPLLQLTEDDLEQVLPSGKQPVFSNRLHWAKMYLTKAGLLESVRRGHFIITERGKSVLAKHLPRIDNLFLAQYPEFANWRQISSNSESTPIIDCAGTSSLTTQKSITTETSTPEEQIETAHATLTAALRADLLDRIKAASPAFFEQLIVDLLVALGYGGGREEMGRALGKSGDGGVDGIIKEDALGLDVVYIQAKRYTTGAVGRPEVQGFAGSLAGFKATKGVFVTTSRFAASAKEYVDRIQARIVLIDGDELTRLLVKHNVGVRVREVYQVKKVDEDYFDIEI